MGQEHTDMDWVLVEELEAEKRQIDKKLEALHIVIQLKQERASRVDIGGRRSSTYAQELTDAIYDTLSSERPLHRSVILERVTERGIHIGATKPINSVGSYLSTDGRFKNCGRGMWTLKDEPITEIPAAENGAAGIANTPLQGANLRIDDIRADTGEDPAISILSRTVSMSQDEMLICRRCKVAAQVKFADGEMDSIACPSCEALVEGDAARKMYLDQARYFAMREAQNSFKRAFRTDRSVRYEPSRISDPGNPFIIGRPES